MESDCEETLEGYYYRYLVIYFFRLYALLICMYTHSGAFQYQEKTKVKRYPYSITRHLPSIVLHLLLYHLNGSMPLVSLAVFFISNVPQNIQDSM